MSGVRRDWWWLLLLLWALGGSAAAEASLNVSPSRVVLQGKPGETRTGFFVLENRGEEPLDVDVAGEDWSGGISGTRGPVPWLTLKPTHLRLRAGKQSRVKYVVRIPKGSSGELRTQIFFSMEQSEPGGLPMRSRLGTILYVTIEGTEHVDGAVTAVQGYYTAATPGVREPDRLEVVIKLHNRGNVHIVPEGEVIIRDDQSRVVETLRLQSGWGLLPNEEDAYRAIGHGISLKPGRYQLEISVRIGGDVREPITLTKAIGAVVTEQREFRLLEEPGPSPSH